MQVGVMQASQPFWTPSWYCSQLMLPYAAAAERSPAPPPSPPSYAAVELPTKQKRCSGSSFTIDAILGISGSCSKESRSAAAARQLTAASHPYFPVFSNLCDAQREREQQQHYSCHSSSSKGKVVGHTGKSSSDRCKRIRTIFTSEQLSRLEEEFAKQQYMVGTERFYLASKLRLSEAQVKVWFQNRRIKWRKQTLDRSSPAHSDSEAAFSGSDDTCSDSGSDSCSGSSMEEST